VSRFSIPFDSRRHDVARDFKTALQFADQVSARLLDRQQAGDRLAPLGDDHAVRADVIHQGQAPGFEIAGGNRLHGHII
jgi:hypothetical protein